MRKQIFFIVIMLGISLGMVAIPARRGVWKTITLENGSTVRVELRGDEYGRFWRTEDGRMFQQIDGTETYKPVTKQQISDEFLAERQNSIALHEQILSKLPMSRKQRSGIGESMGEYIGKKKCLCILVDFPNEKFKKENDIQAFKDQINMIGYQNKELNAIASVRDYFLAQSGGLFDIEFDVVGPYTSSHNMEYYGQNVRGKDVHVGELIEEAIDLADPDVDFNDYDWDGDGVCEAIYIVYAGVNEADGGPDDTIWPHKSVVFKQKDGIHIIDYACGSELGSNGKLDGISTMCHEYSHCLGLPDLYDVDYACDNVYDNLWDLMAMGTSLGDGCTPPMYSAYERMFCGWLTPEELPSSGHFSLSPVTRGGGAYIIRNDKNPDEYYLLEARAKEGIDYGLIGHGMLIWHVDYVPKYWLANNVNCLTYSNHEHLQIVRADNNDDANYESISNDAFPTRSNNQFTDFGTPGALWFGNNKAGKKNVGRQIINIVENADNEISFDVYETLPMTAAPEGSVFYESFDLNNNLGCKGGNSGGFNTMSTLTSVNDNTGWTGNSLRGGAQCLIVGNGESKDGDNYATTPNFSLTPGVDYVVSFRAAPYSIKTVPLELSATNGGELADTSFALTRSAFVDCTTVLKGSYLTKLNFSRNRTFYLDEVLVMPADKDGISNTYQSVRPTDTYNIQGQRLSTMQPGLMIVNGKKVVVR